MLMSPEQVAQMLMFPQVVLAGRMLVVLVELAGQMLTVLAERAGQKPGRRTGWASNPSPQAVRIRRHQPQGPWGHQTHSKSGPHSEKSLRARQTRRRLLACPSQTLLLPLRPVSPADICQFCSDVCWPRPSQIVLLHQHCWSCAVSVAGRFGRDLRSRSRQPVGFPTSRPAYSVA